MVLESVREIEKCLKLKLAPKDPKDFEILVSCWFVYVGRNHFATNCHRVTTLFYAPFNSGNSVHILNR